MTFEGSCLCPLLRSAPLPHSAAQDAMLRQLHEKVCEVYRCCAGPLDGNISTLQMLTSIEHKMLQSIDALELLPQDKVTRIWATKEKEARIRFENTLSSWPHIPFPLIDY